MNKNNIIGFLLIAVVLIGFSWYNQPSAEEQRAAFVQDSIAKAKHAEMEKASKAAAAKRQADAKAKVEADSTALFYSALKGQAKKIVLKNEKVELTLNTKGATVEKAVIKGYVGHNLQVKDGSADAKDVTLFDGNDQSLKFMLEAKEANIITSDLYFTPSNVTDKSVTMTAVAGEGKTLTLTYTLGNDYMLHMSLQANGMAGLFSPNYNKMDVDWSDKARQQERGFMFENRYTTLTYHNVEGGTDHLNEGSEKIDEKIEETIDWVSFKNQFFSAIIVAKDNFEKDAFMTSIPQEKGSGYLKQFQAKMKTAEEYREGKYLRQGLGIPEARIPGMAYHPLDQPFLHTLRIRLVEQRVPNGYRIDSHHLAPQAHHLPYGEEELHEFSQDARAETKTRSSYSSV